MSLNGCNLCPRSKHDPDVRVVAAEALHSIGDERALPAPVNAEKHDKGKDYEDRTVANAAHEATAAIKKRTLSRSASDPG